jgi:hypothetical protein
MSVLKAKSQLTLVLFKCSAEWEELLNFRWIPHCAITLEQVQTQNPAMFIQSIQFCSIISSCLRVPLMASDEDSDPFVDRLPALN